MQAGLGESLRARFLDLSVSISVSIRRRNLDRFSFADFPVPHLDCSLIIFSRPITQMLLPVHSAARSAPQVAVIVSAGKQ